MMTLDEILETVEGHLYEDEAHLLHRLASEAPAGTEIVEIGSYRGRSTCVLAHAAAQRGGYVEAIDPHYTYVDGPATFGKADDSFLRENLYRAGLDDYVTCYVMSSEAAAALDYPPIGLVFIDGDHSYEACKFDFTTWSLRLVTDGSVAIHDSGYETVARVIAEAVAEGWQIVERVDSTTVLRRSS